ncbi:hypothetical protein P389DRAFT_142170 [Cystobasidium minutum MCA 4210]|uniref:uncharacterized protein n=1 Tax=Cystobasidium minutum MCA 4210 TaxID=1397322 RepID=UPI0034CF51C0|eukprot:jgi/Rhomi1/142170/e_gw1.3.483.1
MSIDLDWGQLDEELCSRALAGINEALKTCKKPNFLGDIRATSFSLGKVSPQLEIVEIRDVFEEFLHVEHEDEEDHHPRPPRTAESQSAVPQNGASSPTSGISLQLHFRVKYLGNMSISLSTTLKVNYPSPSFMSLPLNLRITGLAFEGLLVVAYEGDKKRLHVSVLDESDPDRTKIVKGTNLLKHAFVESEVGQADKLVLKDVAKVEQFVLEMARKALQDEIAWPNFQSFAWT